MYVFKWIMSNIFAKSAYNTLTEIMKKGSHTKP